MAVVQRRLLQPGERIRVMVVDDSVVIRRLVTLALEQDPMIEVVGTASNGAIGLQRIPQFNPDVITLDIEMPDMNGLDMLRRVRREYPHCGSLCSAHSLSVARRITLQALTLGADDYVAKVSNEGSLDRSNCPSARRNDPEDQAVLPCSGKRHHRVPRRVPHRVSIRQYLSAGDTAAAAERAGLRRA